MSVYRCGICGQTSVGFSSISDFEDRHEALHRNQTANCLRCGRPVVNVDLRGWLLDDFDIIAINHALLIRNVPSPAATASISVGDVIAEMASQTFGFQGRRTSNKSA